MFRHLFARLTDGSTPLYLAPQAGVSESPFRRLCRSLVSRYADTEDPLEAHRAALVNQGQ